MFAEAAHSLADTVNQGFLLVSIRLAVRDPTPEQPFGYGRMRFLWTFMAAIGMFLAGATFAVGYGIYQLTKGPSTGEVLAAYITLAFSAVAEGSSWVRAIRHTRADARELNVPLLRYLRESRDPNVKMVVFEDTAAMIGIAIALAGIVIDQLTGSSVFDPAASIAIGLLLIAVAAWMAHDTSELLVGASARPAERAAIERALTEFEQIDKVIELLDDGPGAELTARRGSSRFRARSRRRRCRERLGTDRASSPGGRSGRHRGLPRRHDLATQTRGSGVRSLDEPRLRVCGIRVGVEASAALDAEIAAIDVRLQEPRVRAQLLVAELRAQ